MDSSVCCASRWGVVTGCLLALAGCGSGEKGIRSVSGKITVDSTPAAKGSIVTFANVENDSDSFSTTVQDEGAYKYRVPDGVVLKQGEYLVVVRPLRYRTETLPDGMFRDVLIPGVPKSYGPVSDPKTTDFRVKLAAGRDETVDIAITTPAK